MCDVKLSKCLFIDLKTDEQRRDWFSLGRGVATGIIAPALQTHLVNAYSKIVESSKLIERLEQQAKEYGMSASAAHQYRAESKATRKALGVSEDSDSVSPRELREAIEQQQQERDALAAALAIAKKMFHDYEMDVDCPAPVEHRHKMEKIHTALAKRDAGVVLDMLRSCNVFMAFPTSSRVAQEVIRVVDIKEYADQLRGKDDE